MTGWQSLGGVLQRLLEPLVVLTITSQRHRIEITITPGRVRVRDLNPPAKSEHDQDHPAREPL